LAERSDLIDRRIGLTLPTIHEGKRKPETAFWRQFEEARPRILGAFFDAVSTALRNVETVKLDRVPRMADFAIWAVAAEPALPWRKGAFMSAYCRNRDEANEVAIEASSVATVLRSWFHTLRDKAWKGTATDLLETLSTHAGAKVATRSDWPTRPNVLSSILRRVAPNLRALGINLGFDVRQPGTGTRLIGITAVGCDDGPPSPDGLQPTEASRQNRDLDPASAVGGGCDDRDDGLTTPPRQPLVPDLHPNRVTRLNREARRVMDSDPVRTQALFDEADKLDQAEGAV
jgi:hypothetical protein